MATPKNMEDLGAILQQLLEGQAAMMAEQASIRADMTSLNANLNDFKTTQLAYNNSTTKQLNNIEDRLTLVEAKSRPTTPRQEPPAPAVPAATVPPAGAADAATRVTTFAPSPQTSPAGAELFLPETPMFGPTGLPVTPAPGREQKPERKDRPDRRDTIHLREVKTAEAVAQAPVYHAVLAPHDHITYNKSGLPAFFKFWDAILLYEQQEGTRINAAAKIARSVQEHLISKDMRRLGNGQFYRLPRDVLYAIMQADFRPNDRLEFMKLLEANVEFEISSHYRPSPEYYRPLFDALLAFIMKFTKVYEILIYGIRDDPTFSKTILPPVNNKEGGLVKAFVVKIPFEHGTRILKLLDATKWDTLYLFIKDFKAIINQNLEDSERARKLRRTFGGTQYEAKRFDQKLQHLQELMVVPDDDVEQDQQWKEALDAERAEAEAELDTMLAAAMQQPQRKPAYDRGETRDPLVCITMLLHGSCTKTGCKYTHVEAEVVKKRREFLDLIQKRLAGVPAAPRPHAPQKLAVMEDIYDEDDQY